eukprot:7387255-Prymnesium_polylepis.1
MLSAAYVACRGIRLDGAGWEQLCDLDRGGVITPEYVFEKEVRPLMNNSMSYAQTLARLEEKKGEDAAADFAQKQIARANELQRQHGGLYRGHRDCVRSTVCDIDFGLLPDRVCLACSLLLVNQAFRQRLGRREENVTVPPPRDMRDDYMASEQKRQKLGMRTAELKTTQARERRKDRSHAAMLEAANERFNQAQAEALA